MIRLLLLALLLSGCATAETPLPHDTMTGIALAACVVAIVLLKTVAAGLIWATRDVIGRLG